MRYVNMVLGTLMVLFAAVQYNDPDGPLWALIYAVPAAWAFAAAFRLEAVRSAIGIRLLGATLALGLAMVVFYWPTTPEFWRKDVWWVTEEAREGMGVMVGFIVLLAVLAATRRKAPRPPGT